MSAVMCKDPHILCLAGAGTGKTYTMIERIFRLVQDGVNPSSILVLTFTNAAAFEMKSRYQSKSSSKRIPEFRTFHSFCYHVLATNSDVRSSLGYTSTPTIADENTSKRIKKEAQTIAGIKSSIESLEKKEVKSKAEQLDYELLKKASFKLMKQRNTITFDDLCSKICKLFTDNSECIQFYKNRYKYIFVDEFQDTDPVQYNFVKSFVDSFIFVVGDALQSLYSFRGADSSIIKGLSIDPEWTTIKLFKNYRSPKTICDFANNNSKYADDNFRVAIESGKGEEGEPVDYREYSDSMFYGDISKESKEYCLEDVLTRPGSTAILFRTNREVNTFQAYCDSKNILYRSGKKTADVENILLSIGDNDYLLNWLSTYLNSESYADFLRVSTLRSDDNPYTVSEFLKDYGRLPAVSERMEVVRAIRHICKDDTRAVVDRCKDILKVIGCEVESIDESICSTMKEGVDYVLDVYKGATEEPGSDIYIGTVHSVKGLEFDNVYVFGVNGSTFKLNNEENKNIYYVAITRAKKHLVVFKNVRLEF